MNGKGGCAPKGNPDLSSTLNRYTAFGYMALVTGTGSRGRVGVGQLVTRRHLPMTHFFGWPIVCPTVRSEPVGSILVPPTMPLPVL